MIGRSADRTLLGVGLLAAGARRSYAARRFITANFAPPKKGTGESGLEVSCRYISRVKESEGKLSPQKTPGRWTESCWRGTFARLHVRWTRPGTIHLWAFDHCVERDLRPQPRLVKRQARLQALLERFGCPAVSLSEPFEDGLAGAETRSRPRLGARPIVCSGQGSSRQQKMAPKIAPRGINSSITLSSSTAGLKLNPGTR